MHCRTQACQAVLAVVLTVPVLSCCSAGPSKPDAAQSGATASVSVSSSPSARTPTPGAPYSTTSFSIPFTVNAPTWQPAGPAHEEANFLTWVSADDTHAVRFLAPVNSYPVDGTEAGPVPDDYVAFLESLNTKRLQLGDVHKTTVGGQPATLMSVTVESGGLDGVLGCPAQGVAAEDCYGPQQEKPMRLAIIDAPGGRPLLVWSRQNVGDTNAERAADSAQFEAMLAGLKFR